MNIQTIESQAWWIALSDEIRAHEGIPLRVWIDALQSKFKFGQLPSEIPKSGGFEFRAGTLEAGENLIAVPLLTIFSDGVSVNLQSNTRNAEIVLQATLEIFLSLGLREPSTSPLHYYVSTIVADFGKSLDSLFPPPLLKSISESMLVQGKAQFFAIHLNFDPLAIPGRISRVNPSQFRIERRLEISYDQNRYFCQANTTTEKHVVLLEQLERMV
jgi:hypothetical protein